MMKQIVNGAAFAVLAVIFMAGTPVHAGEKVTIGASKTALLVWIAEEKGFFRDEELEVEIRIFQSGSYAANAVLDGSVDLSTSSESAFVSRSFDHADLRVLSAISASETARLVGRRDRGIAAANVTGDER